MKSSNCFIVNPTNRFLKLIDLISLQYEGSHLLNSPPPIPEIREKLAGLHNGSAEEFEEFLKQNYFDLHYQAKAEAVPVNLGLGHLWRLAVDHPEQKVSAYIHRAPLEKEGEYRLLLIC